MKIFAFACTWFATGMALAQDTSVLYSDRASYVISTEPFLTASLAVGDVDGDGDLDMVEANGRHWPQASPGDGRRTKNRGGDSNGV
jgi:hypothetical protein